MTIQRMEHVGIVVDDLAAATEFFVELGLELQGEGSVEGRWVDRIVGLDGVRAEFAMLRTPDGHGRLELVKFHSPSTQGGNGHAPANTPGIRHLAFAVEDIDAVVAGLRAPAAPSSSASWNATRTATCSATSAAPRGSSSSWQSRSADGSGPPPTADHESVCECSLS
jgi:catechol 2,3-dioxygenase-like lactoylglutathione lyase family enzyme